MTTRCRTLGFALLLLGLLASYHPLSADEGFVLEGAWNLHNGRALYTEFFEFVTPLGFYLPHWLWLVTGPSYLATRLAVVAALGAAAVGCLVLAREAGGEPHASWSSVLFLAAALLWPAINGNTFNIVFTVAALVLVLRGVRLRSTAAVTAGGFAAGLATLCLQHKGLVLTLAVLLALVLERLRRPTEGPSRAGPACFLLASLVPPAMLFLWWDPATLRENLFDPLLRYRLVNAVPPHLAVATALLAGALVYRLRGESGFAPRCLVLAGLGLLGTALQRPDLMHLSVALVPLLCLVPLAHARSGPRLRLVALGCVTTLVAAPLALHLLAGRPSAAGRQALVAAIREACPGPTILAGPFLPWVYFETGKLNPTRYFMLLTDVLPDAILDEVAASLRAQPPPCVVWDPEAAAKFGYRLDNPVERFLRESYDCVRRCGSLEILRRRRPYPQEPGRTAGSPPAGERPGAEPDSGP